MQCRPASLFCRCSDDDGRTPAPFALGALPCLPAGRGLFPRGTCNCGCRKQLQLENNFAGFTSFVQCFNAPFPLLSSRLEQAQSSRLPSTCCVNHRYGSPKRSVGTLVQLHPPSRAKKRRPASLKRSRQQTAWLVRCLSKLSVPVVIHTLARHGFFAQCTCSICVVDPGPVCKAENAMIDRFCVGLIGCPGPVPPGSPGPVSSDGHGGLHISRTYCD